MSNMKNFNLNNPFVIKCKESYDNLNKTIIAAIKASIEMIIGTFIIVLIDLIGHFLMPEYNNITKALISAIVIFILVIILSTLLVDSIIRKSKIVDINKLIDSNTFEVLNANNELLFNTNLEIENLEGKCNVMINVFIVTICVEVASQIILWVV